MIEALSNIIDGRERFIAKDEEHPSYETGRNGRMKGAQLEDGYSRVANELMEQFAKLGASGREYQILFAVIRYTYGWNRKTAKITGVQFSAMTGLHPVDCSKTLNRLLARNILYRIGGKFGEIGINTKFWEWKERQKHENENLAKSTKFSENLAKSTKKNLAKSTNHINTVKDIKTVEANASTSSTGVDVAAQQNAPQKLNGKKPSALPDCPHDEILGLWARHLPDKPHPKTWNGTRQANLAARWRQGFTCKVRIGSRKGETFYADKESGLVWWDRFFSYCAKQSFLRDGRFFSLDWLVKPANFAKIIDGNYEDGHR